MLISQALCLGHIVLRGLEALLHVHPAQQTNYHLKSTPLKELLRGTIFPKSVQSIINKALNTLYITAHSNNANETSNGVTMYFCVPYYDDKGCSFPVPFMRIPCNALWEMYSAYTKQQ